ncbi:MAG: AsnC family transcriptional regulator [Streptococcaceae bacterium]|nr:AsnC family transcriptional regulator [Streptococcaceae bacterium]
MDSIDLEIINLLKSNSRLTHKEIGQQIHLTGQAVGTRITRLVDQGNIEKFTVTVKEKNTQIIQLLLNGDYFQLVKNYCANFSQIEQLYPTSGQACAIIIAHFNKNSYDSFLIGLDKWARYQVDTVIEK